MTQLVKINMKTAQAEVQQKVWVRKEAIDHELQREGTNYWFYYRSDQ